MPATNVAIVRICGYKLPRARMCGTCDFLFRPGLAILISFWTTGHWSSPSQGLETYPYLASLERFIQIILVYNSASETKNIHAKSHQASCSLISEGPRSPTISPSARRGRWHSTSGCLRIKRRVLLFFLSVWVFFFYFVSTLKLLLKPCAHWNFVLKDIENEGKPLSQSTGGGKTD